MSTPQGHAVLLGDRDLGAPLYQAGVPVTALTHPGAATRFSRYYSSWLSDPRPDEEALAHTLIEHACGSPGPVALFYGTDADLLFVSRQRQRLSEHLSFVVPEAGLVEELADKAAFQALAERLSLPVPQTHILDTTEGTDGRREIRFPVIVKPIRREDTWSTAFEEKALLIERPEDLSRLLEALQTQHERVVVQQPIPGPETKIESYHAYIDLAGEVVADFTGRKIRTLPAALGHSTAVVTTQSEDVATLGRDVLTALGLRGVAKVDFKRDPAGRLWLLEVNPRFNLWHHVGAAAGVNIPAFVWADLAGLQRPPRTRARAGVAWCSVPRDWLAARESGMTTVAWLRWLTKCQTWSAVDFRDPKPVAAKAAAVARDRLRRVAATGRGR